MNQHDKPRHQDQDGKGRAGREYPHGSGDRNAWAPFGAERMPRHHGGTQREPVDEAPEDAGGTPARGG